MSLSILLFKFIKKISKTKSAKNNYIYINSINENFTKITLSSSNSVYSMVGMKVYIHQIEGLELKPTISIFHKMGLCPLSKC